MNRTNDILRSLSNVKIMMAFFSSSPFSIFFEKGARERETLMIMRREKWNSLTSWSEKTLIADESYCECVIYHLIPICFLFLFVIHWVAPVVVSELLDIYQRNFSWNVSFTMEIPLSLSLCLSFVSRSNHSVDIDHYIACSFCRAPSMPLV